MGQEQLTKIIGQGAFFDHKDVCRWSTFPPIVLN